tara:strand:+ start:137 stop:1411 length:1275 start_codon:yes stop_codon:yes gene_type:complete
MKNNLLKLLTIYLVLNSCSKEILVTEYVTQIETISIETTPFKDSTLEGEIKTNTTLDASKVWLLKGRVSVVDGAILTIPAGTIIKGESGTGADASTLIIARGAKIDAQGTFQKPIIFTSISDNVQIGNIYPTSGPSLNVDIRGLWGGLIILGNAPSSFSGDVSELQIEGIPTSDTSGLYGGVDPNDNSGVLKYVSIRHGGAEIGEGNEINGLTLGAVGSNTIIDNIEVIANVDDGIEFFGGNVNATNLLIWGQGDDAIDIDQGYSGTIDGVLVILTSASDHGLEIDGPEGSLEGRFTLKNVTIIGASEGCDALSTDGEIADFRSKAMGDIDGILVRGFANDKDVELDNDIVAQNYTNNKLTFLNWEIIPLTGCENGKLNGEIFNDKSDTSPFEEDALNFAKIVEESNVGVNESIFDWTFNNTSP